METREYSTARAPRKESKEIQIDRTISQAQIMTCIKILMLIMTIVVSGCKKQSPIKASQATTWHEATHHQDCSTEKARANKSGLMTFLKYVNKHKVEVKHMDPLRKKIFCELMKTAGDCFDGNEKEEQMSKQLLDISHNLECPTGWWHNKK